MNRMDGRNTNEASAQGRWTLVTKALLMFLAVWMLLAVNAYAVLERVGPVSLAPSVGGFPAWYQDTTGLTLEFCDPKNQSEVDGGWCLLLPGDVAVPEVFPTNFFDEHFYFAASAAASAPNGERALLVLAEESAFAVGPARPGDQVTFSRIRVVLNPVPVTGTYRFIHPYGEELIDGVAGGRVFFTEDIGIGAPGDFSGALSSRLGPFLLPSATPGGLEMSALTAANPTPDADPAHFGGAFTPTPYPGTGKAYIADPARIGPITGSSLPDFIDSTGASRNHNIFRIEGPNGFVAETTDFSLMGRVYTGSIPSRINVERASYARNAGGQKVAVFATASDTTQARVPRQPRPAGVTPQLTYFDAACAGSVDPNTGEVLPPYSAPAGANEIQMFSIAPGIHSGQNQPAVVPSGVCVRDSAARDANGNIVALFVPKVVTDEVSITQALFDQSAGTLTVTAVSSDEVNLPTLRVAFGTFQGNLANGQIVVPGLIATPSSVRVTSSALGVEQAQVKTAFAFAPPPAIPVAANDSFTFLEDSGVQSLAVLANDANVAGGTVNLTSAPRLGTAVVNTDGTVTFTSNANANGADQFTYTVTVGTQVSNTGTVTLNITPVNDAPVANPDSFTAVANLATTLNVTSNDTDPDGAADIVAVANVSAVTPAPGTLGTGTATAVGKTVSFTGTAAGIYSFTYQARDAAGVLSNPTTVTVTVSSAEAIVIQLAELRANGGRYRVNGSISPAAGQTMTIQLRNAAGTVVRTDTVVSAAGAWALDVSGVTQPAGTLTVRVTSSNGTVATATVTRRQ